MSKPDYTVTKPSGSSVLLCSRNPSDETEGIIVIEDDNVGNLNAAGVVAEPDVGGAVIGHDQAAVGAAQVAGEAAVAAGGAGPGERPPDSDQEDESESHDDGGDGGVHGGDQPQHVPQHGQHAGHGARVRARLDHWDQACGGPRGFCNRALCVKRRNIF